MPARNTILSIVAGLSAIILLTVGSLFFYQSDEYLGIDFLHFWIIPQMVGEMPDSSIYDPDDHQLIFERIREVANESKLDHLKSLVDKNAGLYSDGIHPTGSPFLYASFGLVRTGKFEFDYWAYQLVSTFLMLGGIFALGAAINLRFGRCLAICVIALLLYGSVNIDFGVANTNRFQVGLLCMSFWLIAGRRFSTDKKQNSAGYFLGSVILGLLVAFKLNVILVPVLLLSTLLVDRRFRPALLSSAGLAVGCSVGIVVGAVYFGEWQAWLDWRNYVNEMISISFPLSSGNCTFLANVDSTYLPSLSLGLTLGLCGVVVGAIWLSRPIRPDGQELPTGGALRYLIAAATGLLIPLLTSPVAWSHYFLLALPSMLILLPVFRNLNSFGKIKFVLLGSWLFGTVMILGIVRTWLRVSDANLITIQFSMGVCLLLVTSIVALFVTSSSLSTARSLDIVD